MMFKRKTVNVKQLVQRVTALAKKNTNQKSALRSLHKAILEKNNRIRNLEEKVNQLGEELLKWEKRNLGTSRVSSAGTTLYEELYPSKR